MSTSSGSLLWDPHQGLWNRNLVRALRRLPGGRVLARGVRVADSWLLIGRAARRRARSGGLLAVVRPGPLPPRVVYLDCGLHKTGRQVEKVSRWLRGGTTLEIIGFEASSVHMADAGRALAGVPDLSLHQVALVGPDHSEPSIRLYRDTSDGVGDSLFTGRGSEYDEVPAIRLTTFLANAGIDPAQVPVILRMNIEGAEKYVIEDLVEAGMHGKIAGYYGMWDDLGKLEPALDREFRALLQRRGIHTFTFNDRDSSSALRLWAIRYDLRTSLSRNG